MLQSYWRTGSAYQKHEIELEYGVTNSFSLAPYLVFKRKDAAENVHAEALKLEGRYRFFEEGVLPVDIGTYFDFERPFDFSAPNELEGKLILSRTMGPWALAVNGVLKQSFANLSPLRYGGTAGLSYALLPMMCVSLEGLAGSTAGGTYVGPTVSWFEDPVRLSLGILAGTTPGSEPFLVSLRFGTEF